ncbi:transcription factor-like protein DPB isoform X2 [Telopea speciosissima]|uniref:transcription factor-like protein DPB isoform X2 n=1 Tax=Telopea speciosissima TaxID=54955 RepID=UPI001CC3D169|nr:transcription factor-like protein DPB isoform X2 [Telopea speciosissima]
MQLEGDCSADSMDKNSHKDCSRRRSSIGTAVSSTSDCGVVVTGSENIMGANNMGTRKENISTKKKKRVSRIIDGGLRELSIIVCKKVECKGRTTYSEVADEIIVESAAKRNNSMSLDEFDEKNIRRRVYDAINVLMALNIVTKDKKEIQWKGLPCTDTKDLEDLEGVRIKLINSIQKKAAYLQDLEEQIVGIQNLIRRNQQMDMSGISSEGFSLPFILVQTRPHATVEIEISEDMQLVHFDFNCTPFSLHDDAYILKLMQYYHLPRSRCVTQRRVAHSSSSFDP